MAEKKFAIRFSAEDMDKVRAALKGMGTDGASALRAIETGSSKATPALRTVDNVAKDVRSSFDAFASRIPIIGSSLQALGPIGTTVGVGLAGIVLGANALGNSARQAVDDISKLKDAADSVALSVEDFQSVRGGGLLAGIDPEAMDSMLSTLAINAARNSEGFGKMHAALEKVNPELGKQLALTTNQAERLDLLARATQQASSYNDKLNISVAAFGSQGGQMVRVLDESGASLDTWTAKAKAAGLVIDDGLVKMVEQLGDRLDVLDARIGVSGQRLAVAAAPMIEGVKGLTADVMDDAAMRIDALKPVMERQTFTLEELRKRWEAYSEQFGGLSAAQLARLQEINAELERRNALTNAATQDAARVTIAEGFDKWAAGFREDTAAADKKKAVDAAAAAAAADKAAADAARERAAQEKAAIDIRAALGDWTGKLAQREAELAVLVKAGALSREDANATLAKYRGELDGSTATLAKWKSAVESTQTPVEKAQAALEEFVAEAMLLGDRGPAFQAALRYYSGALEDAERAAKEATPAFKAVAEARDAIARDTESHLSLEERVAAVQERQNALIGEYGYTAEEAAAKTRIFREELERQAATQRDASFEARFASETLDEILNDNIKSWNDLGRVASRVLADMVKDWLRANQSMAKDQGLFEFIGNAFASAFAGGGSKPGGGGGGSNEPTDAYAFHHAGTASVGPNSGTFSRMLPAAVFHNAPRFHSGLAPDEFPSVLQRGERVLSVVHNERLVQAVERGGAAQVEVNFYGDFGGKPEVTQSQNADGSTRIDIKQIARDGAAEFLTSRAGQKLMRDQYNLNRAVGS